MPIAFDEQVILRVIEEELAQSAGGNENDFIDANRQKALAAYLGQPNGKEVDGRSKITDTAVADAIEWIMPEVVKAFTQNNEVVTFDAVGPGDEDQADMESQYVYDVLMKDNEGFIIIHQLIKDALMQKNGFVKTFYEKSSESVKESYTGLTDLELEMVLSDPKTELVEQTTETLIEGDMQISSHDIRVAKEIDTSGTRVVSVPPEEFRVNKQHNSVSLKDARFTAHVYLVSAGDLVDEGFDREFIDSIPTAQVYEDDREYRFYMQDETVYPDRDVRSDPSLRQLEVAECFMHLDIDDDGIAELVKVRVAGGDNPNVLLDIEEIDSNPFDSSVCILMSHKLFGLSIYDRLKEIQEQKTTLWRNIFDNMYLQNNQRSIAIEGQVNLDDLMVSRPGGIIRAKSRGAVEPYVTPPISGDAYKMMDYLDQVAAGRSGASSNGPVNENLIGDRVGSEGIANLVSKQEEVVGLMTRVIAEVCIKPMCYKIRDEAIKHQDTLTDYNYRGDWVQLNPSSWRNRKHTTVRVGTGSGDRKQQSGAITQLIMMQEKIFAMPGQALVRPDETFAALNDYAKMNGLPGAGRYFLDPKSEKGQEHKQQVDKKQQQQQKMMMEKERMQLEATMKIAKATEAQVAAEAQNGQLKNQISAMKEQHASAMAEAKQQLAEFNTGMAEVKHHDEMAFKYYQVDENNAVKLEQIDATAKMAAENNKDKESKDDSE